MAAGAVGLVTSWLNTTRGGGAGTSYTAPAALYAQLHTASPGAAGTTSVSAETTRQAVTFGAPSSGTTSLSNTPQWTSWSAGSETITHLSIWDASSAGNCLFTVALSSSVAVANGDTLQISTLTQTITPAS